MRSLLTEYIVETMLLAITIAGVTIPDSTDVFAGVPGSTFMMGMITEGSNITDITVQKLAAAILELGVACKLKLITPDDDGVTSDVGGIYLWRYDAVGILFLSSYRWPHF